MSKHKKKRDEIIDLGTLEELPSGSFVLKNALRVRKEYCEVVNNDLGLDIDVDVKNRDKDTSVHEFASYKNRRRW